jgi:lipopolysaccharide transport system ATP-binding protein
LTFSMHEGDRVALVGHNGSGKTTLLRVLAGAYEPVVGSIEVNGRVASMLSIVLGIDPDATGYENISLRAAIMGMRVRDIPPLVQEICDFSELGEFIDMPIRTYSTGMMMRLAFAISTCVPADIVLMDEWLAVGDPAFREKAQQRLRRMVDRAKILVLASHDERLIRDNCNRILRLDHGTLVSDERIGA